MHKPRFEYVIVVWYLLFGAVWILLSDKVLQWVVSDVGVVNRIQLFKGWFYVLVTAVLLGFFIRKQLKQMRSAEDKLLKQVKQFKQLTHHHEKAIQELQERNKELLAVEEELRAGNEELYQKQLDLEESETKFRTVVTSSTPIIFMYDTEGTVLLSEGKMLNSVGLKPGDVVGQNVFEMNKDNPDIIELQKRPLKGEVVEELVQYEDLYFESFYTPYRNRIGEIVGVIATSLDVTEKVLARKQLEFQERTIRKIVQQTAEKTGQEYYNTLVLLLNEVLEADYTFIGLMRTDENEIRTIALCNGAELGENIVYFSEDTPCETVIGNQSCVYSHDVQGLFPKDHLLVEMGVEAYVGSPITSVSGQFLGLIVSLYRHPISDSSFAVSLFELFASKIGSELEREAAEQKIISKNQELQLKNKLVEESEGRFRLLFENMSEGFALHEIVTDENNEPIDYIFKEVNTVYQQRTGIKRERIINKSAFEVFPDTDMKLVKQFGEVALKGKPLSFVYYSDKLDQYFDTHFYCPQKGYFASIFTDVTDKKKAEEALKKSELRFKTIFQKSKTVMLLIDPEKRTILDFNEVAANFYGYSGQEMDAMSMLNITQITPEQFDANVQKALKGEQNSFRVSHRLHSNAIVHVDAHLTPITINDQVLLNVIVIDRTKEILAHKELERINKRFEGLENIIHYQANSINDLLDFTMKQILDYTQSDVGFLYHYRAENRLFILNNWTDQVQMSQRLQDETMRDQKGDCLHRAVTEKRAIIINQPESAYSFFKDHKSDPYKSLTIPVVLEDEVVAVVWIGSLSREFTEFDAKQMELLLETTWILVEKQKLQDTH
jgi:PAS domain S-box-containing protein